MEQAEGLGEPPENPLLLYSVLYGFWITNAVAFNGDAALGLAGQFLELAEKQGASVPLSMGHGIMGFSLLVTGNFTQSLRQTDQALALYNPAVHRPLTMLFGGQDMRVTNLTQRSLALWFLGYPDAALAGANRFLKEARQTDQVGTLFTALNFSIVVHFLCGAHPTADAMANELVTLADEQDAAMWKPVGLVYRGWILAVADRASEAVQLITSALDAIRATGTTLFRSVGLSLTAKCYADLGQLDDARRSVDEATIVVERTKETWFEADVYRIAGEIALKAPKPDAAKAEGYFERALAIARQQQAKSLELRAAMLWYVDHPPEPLHERTRTSATISVLAAGIFCGFLTGWNFSYCDPLPFSGQRTALIPVVLYEWPRPVRLSAGCERARSGERSEASLRMKRMVMGGRVFCQYPC
jgi:tetratricopeptide (TPR) repeat protein